MPRSARSSDEETESRAARRTRATAPAVTDSPLRRSTRLKTAKRNDSSHELSPVNDSTTQKAPTVRRRLATMESDSTETRKFVRSRKNSGASDTSEGNKEDTQSGISTKRTTRKSAMGLASLDSRSSGLTSKRYTRAGSETKSPAPSTVARKVRASSMDPELKANKERMQMENASTPKTKKRVSSLLTQSPVTEENENHNQSHVIPENTEDIKDITVNVTAESVSSSNKSLEANNTSITMMKEDVSPISKQPLNDSLTRHSESNIVLRMDSSPKTTKTATTADDVDRSSSELFSKSPRLSQEASKELGLKIENLLNTSVKDGEKSTGNKENEDVNIPSKETPQQTGETIVSTASLHTTNSFGSGFTHKISKEEESFSTSKECVPKQLSKNASNIQMENDNAMDGGENNTSSKIEEGSLSHSESVMDINMSRDKNDSFFVHGQQLTPENSMSISDMSLKQKAEIEGTISEMPDVNKSNIEIRNSTAILGGQNLEDASQKDDSLMEVEMEAPADDKKSFVESINEGDTCDESTFTKESNISNLNKNLYETTGDAEECTNKHPDANQQQSINTVDTEPTASQQDNDSETNVCSNLNDSITLAVSDADSTKNTSLDEDKDLNESRKDHTQPTDEINDVSIDKSDKAKDVESLSGTDPEKNECDADVDKSSSPTKPVDVTENAEAAAEGSHVGQKAEENTVTTNAESIDEENCNAKMDENMNAKNKEQSDANTSDVELNVQTLFQDIPADEWKNDNKKSSELETNSVHSVDTEKLENESEAECDLVLVDKETWLAAENIKVIRENEVLDSDSNDTVILKSRRKETEKEAEEEIKSTPTRTSNKAERDTEISELDKAERSRSALESVEEENDSEKLNTSRKKSLSKKTSLIETQNMPEEQDSTRRDSLKRKRKSLNESLNVSDAKVSDVNAARTPNKQAISEDSQSSVGKPIKKTSLKISKIIDTDDDEPDILESEKKKSKEVLCKRSKSTSNLDDLETKKKSKSLNRSLNITPSRKVSSGKDQVSSSSSSKFKSSSRASSYAVFSSDDEESADTKHETSYKSSRDDKIEKDENSKENDDSDSGEESIEKDDADSDEENIEKDGTDSDEEDIANQSNFMLKSLFREDSTDGDESASGSMDSDIEREYNLGGKDITELPDDNIPGDECRASESESSDPDDNGSDLADFVVDDDEVEEEEDEEEEDQEENEEDEEEERVMDVIKEDEEEEEEEFVLENEEEDEESESRKGKTEEHEVTEEPLEEIEDAAETLKDKTKGRILDKLFITNEYKEQKSTQREKDMSDNKKERRKKRKIVPTKTSEEKRSSEDESPQVESKSVKQKKKKVEFGNIIVEDIENIRNTISPSNRKGKKKNFVLSPKYQEANETAEADDANEDIHKEQTDTESSSRSKRRRNRKRKLLKDATLEEEQSDEKENKIKRPKAALVSQSPENEISSKKKKNKLQKQGEKLTGSAAAKTKVPQRPEIKSKQDDRPESISFSKARSEALEAMKRVADSIKAGNDLKRKKQTESMERRKREKDEKTHKTKSEILIAPRTKNVKRISEDILENISDVPRPRKKQKLATKEDQTMPSRSMQSSGFRESVASGSANDYIPLTTLSDCGSTTNFSVVNLQKAKKHAKNSAAASFRQKMLARAPRHSVSAYLMYLQKQKATSKLFGKPF